MHAHLPKLPAKMLAERSRARRERRDDAARRPVLHLVMPGLEVARAEPRPRETVAAFLRRTGWAWRDRKYGWQFKKGLPTILEINGEAVLRKDWRHRRIAANDNVRFVSYPLGGGGGNSTKQIIGLVALVAVSAFALWAGPALFGAGTFGALATTAAIGVGGSLLINALVAPKAGATNTPTATQDQIYSVLAQGNAAKLGQPLPVWYGRLKRFPDFAITPWSEFVGNDQYLNVLLSTTMGSLDYEALYIDDTILWDPTNGVSASFPGAQVAFYEPGADVTLFPVNVDQSSEVTGQQLPDGVGTLGGEYLSPSPGTAGAWIGPFVANPPATQAQSIAIDFVLPSGCFTVDTSNNNIGSANLGITAEYAPCDDAGAQTGPFATLFSVTRSYASTGPIRDSIKRDVSLDRYLVRFRREDAGIGSTNGSNAVIWAGLRSFLKGNNSFPDVSTLAIRLLASQSTQGSYKFGVVATRKLPVWSGSSFVTQATRSPAWAFLDAVTNSQYGSTLPIAKVDFNAVVANASGCTARGDTFDYCFSAAVAVPDALDKILTSSRARHFWLGDTVSIVRDQWRDVPTMMLTDREIVRDSTQVTFTMLGDEDPDAVIVEYVDQNTWLPAQVQYPPDSVSFTAENAETKRVDGIVNRAQAYRECAFYYLQSIYRRENVQFDVEYEGRAITFGSVLRIQSELPQSYGYGGAVVGISGAALTLDPAPTWDVGPFYIRLRMPNGSSFGPVLCTQGSDAAHAVLDSASLSAAQTAQSTTLAAVLAREDGAEYPSFELGTGVSESKLCVVLNGTPKGELFTLSMAVDDERVHATDLGDPPVLPSPKSPLDPKVPLVTGLNAKFGQGTAEPKLSASWFPAAGALYYIADVSYDSGEHWSQVYQGAGNSFDVVVTLGALRLRVQAVNASVRGPYSALDLEAPTIEVADNTVTIKSVTPEIHQRLIEAMDQIGTLNQRVNSLLSSLALGDLARNWLDKQALRRELASVSGAANAQITELWTVATNTEAALAQTQLDLATEVGAANSRIDVTNTSLTTLTQTVADQNTVLTADFNGVTASLSSEIQTRSSADGALSARIDSLTAQTDNSFASVNQQIVANTNSISSLAAQQTTFQTSLNGHTATLNLLASSVNGNSVYLGIVGTIDGVTGGLILTGFSQNGHVTYNLLLNGNLLVDGSVKARSIAIDYLSALTADLGTVRAGKLISQNGKTTIDLNAGTFVISD